MEHSKSQLHCFVDDNAANMKKAMVDGGYTYVGCFAHTLQLIIKDGILSQRYVQDILAKYRRIVGHFKHSQLAYSRLKEIQSNLGGVTISCDFLFFAIWHCDICHHPLHQCHQSIFFQQLVTYMMRNTID